MLKQNILPWYKPANKASCHHRCRDGSSLLQAFKGGECWKWRAESSRLCHCVSLIKSFYLIQGHVNIANEIVNRGTQKREMKVIQNIKFSQNREI